MKLETCNMTRKLKINQLFPSLPMPMLVVGFAVAVLPILPHSRTAVVEFLVPGPHTAFVRLGVRAASDRIEKRAKFLLRLLVLPVLLSVLAAPLGGPEIKVQ